MAESEMSILIKAVDEVSATVKNIENNLAKTTDNVAKQNETLSESFTKAQGNILLLGNAAASVDRIMDSYSNLQLRLENSTDRVANASDRLEKAKRNLATVQNNEKSSTDDLLNAQMELEQSTRGLSIANNNLERTNSAVTGTYISMGMNIVSLVASIPALVGACIALVPSLISVAVGVGAVTIAGAPLWAILLAIIAAIAAAILIWKNWDVIVKALGTSFTWFKDTIIAPVWAFLQEMFKWVEFILLPLITLWKFELELMGAAFSWLWNDILKPIYEWLKSTFLTIWDTLVEKIQWVADKIGVVVEGAKKLWDVVSKPVKETYRAATEVRDTAVSSSKKKNDFIMRPGQSAVSFSPDDTVIGFKKGGIGTNINVSIDSIYGINSTDISNALQKKLGAMIR